MFPCLSNEALLIVAEGRITAGFIFLPSFPSKEAWVSSPGLHNIPCPFLVSFWGAQASFSGEARLP